jgi:hypothetical protein
LQADLPFLSLAGQFAQVHWPGAHVHSVLHLSRQLHSSSWRGNLRARSLLLILVGAVGAGTFPRRAGA